MEAMVVHGKITREVEAPDRIALFSVSDVALISQIRSNVDIQYRIFSIRRHICGGLGYVDYRSLRLVNVKRPTG